MPVLDLAWFLRSYKVSHEVIITVRFRQVGLLQHVKLKPRSHKGVTRVQDSIPIPRCSYSWHFCSFEAGIS